MKTLLLANSTTMQLGNTHFRGLLNF